MKHPFAVFTIIFSGLFFCFIQENLAQQQTLRLGADRLDEVTALLKGKRVGLLVNHTSLLTGGRVHLLDALL
jgi:uncharacterized protein YbbC (DUF1343 family)